MALTKTTTQLATAVLEKLCIIDATETADDHTEARDLIVRAYEDKWQELQDREMVYHGWTITAVPSAIFLIIRDLVANEVRETFGEPMSQGQMMSEEEVIIRRLRRHIKRDGIDPLSNHVSYF